MAKNIANLTFTIRHPDWLNRLVIWCETWGEFLPDRAKDEFSEICWAAFKATKDTTDGA